MAITPTIGRICQYSRGVDDILLCSRVVVGPIVSPLEEGKMNVNMVSLKLEKLESGHIQVSPISREMVESARLDGKKAWARNLILTAPEVKDAIRCARGESEYLPWYDDIGHLIRVHPHGIRELYLNSSFNGKGGKYEEYNFNIPGEVLAGWLEDILEDGAV